MIINKADEFIEKSFESCLNRYQNNSEKSMKSGAFVLNCVNLLYYKCYKINSNRGGS